MVQEYYRVTTTKMRDIANELETLNNQFKKAVEELKTDNQTLGQQWEGDSRNKFNEEFLKDVQKFNEFSEGIKKFYDQLRRNAEAYDKVENRNRDIAAVRKA